MIKGEGVDVVEVLLNQAIDLHCEISGTEPIDVEWQKNGQTIDLGGIRGGASYVQISSRGRKLHLLSAQVSDTARYTCIARNSAGEARKTFDLRVLGKCPAASGLIISTNVSICEHFSCTNNQ